MPTIRHAFPMPETHAMHTSCSPRQPHRFPAIRLLLLLSSLLALLPASAQAGPTSPDDGCLNDAVCRGHYEQAVKQFESGRYELALGSFQAAYQRRQMPWLLINLGRTLHRLGRPREALQYYDRFRQAEARPDAETAARLEKYTAQARTLVDTAGAPLPATAEDDPKGEVGTLPASSGAATTTTPPPATGSPATSGVSSSPGTTPGGAPAVADSTHTPVYKKWWFWTLVGGGALLIVGVGVGAGVASAGSSALPAGVTTITFNL